MRDKKADVNDYDQVAFTAIDVDDNDDVVVLGQPVGKLDTESIKRWLATMDWHELSKNLKDRLMYTWIDQSVCPHCGQRDYQIHYGVDVGQFVVTATCRRCQADLLIIQDMDDTDETHAKVKDFRSGKCGYRRVANVLDDYRSTVEE